MEGREDARAAARLLCAAAAGLAFALPASAQSAPAQGQAGAAQGQAGAAELDPSAPLAPMPDIGVDWPELDKEAPPIEPEAAIGGTEAPLLDAASELRYSVTIEGLEQVAASDALLAALEERSQLRLSGEHSLNAAQIDRRSSDDAELLAELLRSRGYYDATVEPASERRGNAILVTLRAQPGVQYRFASVELPGLAAAGPAAVELRRTFAVTPGEPVIAEEVIAAGIALKVALGEQGFATARIGEQQVEIDHEAHTASLVLPVDPGPVARFGAISVTGEPALGARHVASIARFKRGDPFKRSEVDDLRRALVATGLVAAADIKLVPAADRTTVDLAVHLEPAPLRTIAGELGYGTGEGARLEASWQNRNFVRPEGALTLRGVAGTREQLASVQLRRNNFRRRDQVLNLLASASQSNLAAYEAKTALLSVGLERQSNIIWRKKWTWSVGADLIGTNERGVFDDPAIEQTRKFLIAASPATLYYDGSDDLLNPTSGFRVGGRLSPELSVRGGYSAYARAQLDASAYRLVSDSIVAAARVRLGTIFGARSQDIAPSRRFYAGGGSSVRGYGYQQLGPHDIEDDPTGGRSLAEFALEARVRLKAFGGNFGIVPFLDGGTLTSKATPDFTHWQLGAGIGLRYYSSFGPIRIDVGTPINRRGDYAPVAVAVSLGQAF